MRKSLLTLASCGLTLAAAILFTVGARSYHVQGVRSHDLEQQNAALLRTYDELRGGYVECLQRDVDELAAAAEGGLSKWQEFQERAIARGTLIDP